MNNEFKKILNLLEKLNHDNKEIISSESLNNEYQRIEDLAWLDANSIKYLNILKNSPNLSIDEIMEQICYLDVQLNTYVWHAESVKDIIQTFTKSYEKKLSRKI